MNVILRSRASSAIRGTQFTFVIPGRAMHQHREGKGTQGVQFTRAAEFRTISKPQTSRLLRPDLPPGNPSLDVEDLVVAHRIVLRDGHRRLALAEPLLDRRHFVDLEFAVVSRARLLSHV